MFSFVLSALSIFLVLSNASTNNKLIRRLLNDYQGESIVIAVGNTPFYTRSQCKTAYESQRVDGYTFEEGWQIDDRVYFCIFSEDDDSSRRIPEWKTENNLLMYYDSNREKSVSSTSVYYSNSGSVKWSKDLLKIYGLQLNMDSNVFSIDFIRQSNNELITSVNYKILQPKSAVLNIVLLKNKPTDVKDCNSGDTIDAITNLDTIYVCSQYQWIVSDGTTRMEVRYSDSLLDISSIRPKTGESRVKRLEFDYLVLNSEHFDAMSENNELLFTVNSFIENENPNINNLELANDNMSQEFSFEYLIAME